MGSLVLKDKVIRLMNGAASIPTLPGQRRRQTTGRMKEDSGEKPGEMCRQNLQHCPHLFSGTISTLVPHLNYLGSRYAPFALLKALRP